MRHLVVLRWRDGTSPEQIAAVEAALADLPALIPELCSYHHGPDLGLGAGRWDYGIVAGCADVDDWRAYDRHPAHQKVLVDLIRPHLADRAAVQIGS